AAGTNSGSRRSTYVNRYLSGQRRYWSICVNDTCGWRRISGGTMMISPPKTRQGREHAPSPLVVDDDVGGGQATRRLRFDNSLMSLEASSRVSASGFRLNTRRLM